MDQKKECDIMQCEIIRDLLPLYHDNACSPDSRAFVEEHLAGCASCRGIAEKLASTAVDETFVNEKETVLSAYAKKERRRTFFIGAGTAAFLSVPMIICLIVNLATGHVLDWFFIVFASLLLVASVTAIPLMAPDHRLLWTMGSFTSSLLLLLLVICIYVHGDWFFLAAVPVCFGLSVLFLPYVIYQIPLPAPLSHSKGVLVMLWDTVWLYAVIFVCGLHAKSPLYWPVALKITTFCVILPWLCFLVIRYLRVHPLTRAGIALIFCAVYCAATNGVVSVTLGQPFNVSPLNLTIAVYLLVAGLAMGIGGMVWGIQKKSKGRK